MNKAQMRVAIIGGGWAGLACAVELSAAGVSVCVFEAARQPGGRARRVEIDGLTLDNGQHLMIGAYRETLRLMRCVGADPEHLLRRLPLQIVYPGNGFSIRLPRLPAPFHLLMGLVTAQGCRMGEKRAAARFIHALRTNGYRLDETLSVAGLLDSYGQQGNLRRLFWDPLCLAALNTAPENASAQIFANVLRDTLEGARENSDLLLPRADLGRLFPDPAARFVEMRGGQIRLSARVEGIDPAFVIHGESFTQLVIATSPRRAARLLDAFPETRATAALLDTYSHEPIGTAYLAYPEGTGLPAPLIGMTGPLGQWVFDRGQLDGTSGLMACVLSGQGHWDEIDDAALTLALHDELEKTLGRRLPKPIGRVIRERRATFSCRPGLLRAHAKTTRPGLWLAGDYVGTDYPATLEAAVRSGINAARGILSEVKR